MDKKKFLKKTVAFPFIHPSTRLPTYLSGRPDPIWITLKDSCIKRAAIHSFMWSGSTAPDRTANTPRTKGISEREKERKQKRKKLKSAARIDNPLCSSHSRKPKNKRRKQSPVRSADWSPHGSRRRCAARCCIEYNDTGNPTVFLILSFIVSQNLLLVLCPPERGEVKKYMKMFYRSIKLLTSPRIQLNSSPVVFRL